MTPSERPNEEIAAIAQPIGEAVVIDWFQEFYAHVMTLRAEALRSARATPKPTPDREELKPEPPPEGPMRPLPPPLPGKAIPPKAKPERAEPSGAEEPLTAQAVAQRLEVVLNQPLELGAAADLRDAARYAMVALADEVFAHLDWPDRDAWRDAPLEVRLFESDVAGEVLFQKIDALLVLPSGEHALLGQIYLLTLSLGFRGKLRGARHDATIDRYRRALYAHALCHPPHVVLSTEGADAGPQLSPAAYAQTIDDELPRRLPTIARWGWVTVGLVGAYLVISHLLWRDAIDPLLQRLGGLG